MSSKICISKRFLFAVLFISGVTLSFVYFSNLLIKKSTTTRTSAKETISKTKILNGVLADENEFPYYVYISLYKNGDIGGCGGSLISEEYVLTAAHCVYDIDAKDIFAVIGLNHIDSKLNAQFSSGVDAVILHEDFTNAMSMADLILTTSDIALLHLTKKAVGVPIISIPNPDRNDDGKIEPEEYPEKVYEGNSGTIIGYGSTEDKDISYDLLKGTVYIQKNGEWAQDKFSLTSKKNVGTCRGDSGGPFIMVINNKPQVIGITSSGGPNCSLYSLYTSVAHYSEWINKKTLINYETGINYDAYGRFRYPSQTSQKSLCTDNINYSECYKKLAFCSWNFSCEKCVGKGSTDEETCQ